MSHKNIKQALILICLIGVLIMPYFVFAGPLSTLTEVGAEKGPYEAQTGDASVANIIGIAITTILSFLGVIFVILMIYGGFLWMTAGGEEEQVKKALSIIQRAIIGLAIIVSAYAIWAFISVIMST